MMKTAEGALQGVPSNDAHDSQVGFSTRYRSGTRSASTSVVTMAVTPTMASTGDHDLRVSSSVTPPLFENIHNPLWFIHDPPREPLATAAATSSARLGFPMIAV